jgi:hypothetical protein
MREYFVNYAEKLFQAWNWSVNYICEYFVNYAEKLFQAWSQSVTIYVMNNTLSALLKNASKHGIKV